MVRAIIFPAPRLPGWRPPMMMAVAPADRVGTRALPCVVCETLMPGMV